MRYRLNGGSNIILNPNIHIVMTKRIVTKIGDIFSAELDEHSKCYFQYIANDLSQLNSSVVRVFDTHYPIGATPKMEEIVVDKVAFYAHTMLRPGIQDGAWQKVGKSNNLGLAALQQVLFVTTQAFKTLISGPTQVALIPVDPHENWYIWHINEEHKAVGKLSRKDIGHIEPSAVYSYISIIDRMRYGFYHESNIVYDVIMRIPRPDVDIYVRKDMQKEGYVHYLHFHGAKAIREMFIFPKCTIRLSTKEPNVDGRLLYNKLFGEVNWRHEDFISMEDFEAKWNEDCQ